MGVPRHVAVVFRDVVPRPSDMLVPGMPMPVSTTAASTAVASAATVHEDVQQKEAPEEEDRGQR